MNITKMSVSKNLRDDLKALSNFYDRPMTKQLEVMVKRELISLRDRGIDIEKLYNEKERE